MAHSEVQLLAVVTIIQLGPGRTRKDIAHHEEREKAAAERRDKALEASAKAELEVRSAAECILRHQNGKVKAQAELDELGEDDDGQQLGEPGDP